MDECDALHTENCDLSNECDELKKEVLKLEHENKHLKDEKIELDMNNLVLHEDFERTKEILKLKEECNNNNNNNKLPVRSRLCGVWGEAKTRMLCHQFY